jgi:hypothetical protein
MDDRDDKDWTNEENLALIETAFAFLKENGVNIPYTVDERGQVHPDEEAFERGLQKMKELAHERRRQDEGS